MEKLEDLLIDINKIENDTIRVIRLMLKLMKMQLFNDGNKRTAMLVANHELIKNGRGIIAIDEEDKVEFSERLIQYYENEDKLEELEKFIYDKCLYGFE